MDAIRKDVCALVDKELESANRKFPLFASPHEGYAVILEEAEEATHAMEHLHRKVIDLWSAVKEDRSTKDRSEAERIRIHAVHVAVEAIQVAAMAEKFNLSFSKDGVSRFCENCGFVAYHNQIVGLPTCNTCEIKEICEFNPKPGEQTRLNCPYHYRRPQQ